MNEIFYYLGLVLSLSFLVISVVLFFSLKIKSAIVYLLENKGIRFNHTNQKNRKMKEKQKTGKVKQDKQAKINTGETELLESGDKTELLGSDDKTELLDVAHEYATALLEADCTEILSDM